MGQTTMVERLYSVSNRVLSLTLIASFVTFAIGSRSVAEDAKSRDGANVRIATFDSESGETFFAASIQPSADKALMKAVSESPADVVIIIDTSASQSGEFRNDSIEAARRVAAQLRPQDKVLVYTADVSATKIGEDFSDAKSLDDSIAAVKRRLPLGNTNLVSVIDQVRASLVGRPQNRTRSIVYIGDGTAADAVDDNALSMLVDALRSDKISIHSIGIGPSVNIPLLAIFANHTGGLVTAAGADFSITEIASEVGAAAVNSPIWVQSSQWFDGMKTVGQHPPLRWDDSMASHALERWNGMAKPRRVRFAFEARELSSRRVPTLVSSYRSFTRLIATTVCDWQRQVLR
jgi:von Willebrand factor type A domain